MPQSRAASPRARTEPGAVDVVVVGAGFAGMYMLHRLRQQGCTVQVFETAGDVGGTWYWNRYPGARCDFPSMDYSYSFDPDLEQEWEWTEKYPTQPEILRYAQHVADRFDLRRDIRFRTTVAAMVWDDDRARWTVHTDQGDEVSARFVVHASGPLSKWKKPEVPGLESFRGAWYHTARWPHEGVDFTGRRVGVIGTGSSAIQAIPLIAQHAADLTVFQRTPNFAIPAHNHPFAPGYQDGVKARYREMREQARVSMFGVALPMPERSALDVDPEERRRVYDHAWNDPDNGLGDMYVAFTDVLVDKTANDTAAEYVRQRIRGIVEDPDVAETLCPKDYPILTKRLCLATDYYETFNRDNVQLVDLRKTPLVEITPAGVRTTDRQYEVDDLVLATGFDALTGALTSIDIRGRGGQRLKDKWAAGPRSYLGLAVHGFPNMFVVAGPQTPTVLSNIIVSIEQHVEWISDAIRHVDEHGVGRIEATAEAEDAWVAHTREVASATLFPTSHSWYLGSNVEGKAREFMVYLGGVGPYRAKCEEVAAKDYEGFVLDRSPAAAGAERQHAAAAGPGAGGG
ncbi:flavin-containing monooxygenase [Geodermatophilus sp. URMC 61]|uniref:flavin-containing monooxygenase n=1 Tax=Geodermatophilus sp. URMC 61 TaxID=3423411 RepID=UPI00406C8D5C